MTQKGRINIKAWSPNLKYMNLIKSAKEPYEEYLIQKKEMENSPAFYFDCSNFFFTKNKDLGIRVLSNICELELENAQLYRIAGYKLDQEKFYEESIDLFQRVLKIKEYEPQSYRDLSLVLEKKGELGKAFDLLYKVVTGKWNSKFNEIELTALTELNHVIEAMKTNEKYKSKVEEYLKKIDKRFIYKMDCAIRISMAWDTDSTDIDLHCYDPNGEHIFYSHNLSEDGGMISRDFTQGYGPEEFLQRTVPKSGVFKVTAKYFASHQQSLTGGTTVLCSFFTDYLRKNEKAGFATLRLQSNKEEINVCEVDFKI